MSQPLTRAHFFRFIISDAPLDRFINKNELAQLRRNTLYNLYKKWTEFEIFCLAQRIAQDDAAEAESLNVLMLAKREAIRQGHLALSRSALSPAV